MCGPYHEEITERQQLERAIERLEKREWCPDAMIALRAAKAHLATLPRTERTVWWATTIKYRGVPSFCIKWN